MSKLAITGVTLPDGSRTDLFVESGRLVDQRPVGATAIDADGLIALPGLVDIHTHLREPGREDAETVESGSRAAARGGFTAVFAMANTTPVQDNAGVVEQVLRLGREAGWVDVHPVGAVSVMAAFVPAALASSTPFPSTAGLLPLCFKFTSIGRMQVWSLHAP